MRQLVVSSWITLDGVFDGQTMDKWFAPYDSDGRQNYIRQGILGSDAVILGRVTYEMLASYWSSLKNNEMGIADKLNAMPKYVVSSTLKEATWNNSTILKGNVADGIAKLKQQPGREIHIEGSATLVESLMNSRLIDEYRFLVQPTIMGSGKRFFKETMHTPPLKLVEARPLDKGVVLLRYQPVEL